MPAPRGEPPPEGSAARPHTTWTADHRRRRPAPCIPAGIPAQGIRPISVAVLPELDPDPADWPCDLWDLGHVILVLCTSRGDVEQLVIDGRLDAYRVGGRLRLAAGSVAGMIEQRCGR